MPGRVLPHPRIRTVNGDRGESRRHWYEWLLCEIHPAASLTYGNGFHYWDSREGVPRVPLLMLALAVIGLVGGMSDSIRYMRDDWVRGTKQCGAFSASAGRAGFVDGAVGVFGRAVDGVELQFPAARVGLRVARSPLLRRREGRPSRNRRKGFLFPGEKG
ncbi:hypothetical protein GCM10009642_46670 [Nocardiopsis metallicus]|uniref:Uncharacterized protein n=1 Tax=Nocardiopsis metallicus TaxID=179819 RepID=A0A840W1M6_9ACTN|nr:hypothetical protein [Nocardiopsis metallicus]